MRPTQSAGALAGPVLVAHLLEEQIESVDFQEDRIGTYPSLPRLKADYDNWPATQSEMMMPPEKAVEYAEQFVGKAEHCLDQKFWIRA